MITGNKDLYMFKDRNELTFFLQIMLGLTSHDPHFSLLREEVKFGKKDKRYTR